MRQRKLGHRWLVVAGLAGVATLVAFNFDALMIGAGSLLGDKRPVLLREARWADPASAEQFNQRFVAGTREALLVDWLQDNRFAVDPASKRAHRLVESLPCNEFVQVSWQAREGKLLGAAATVTEAGCL
ncbi:hypothetical protein ACFPIF_07455 [Brevundimonas faecalis]|uniref:hypothetical protein n=1 Tax=Brevundimonas faecalis TaxID=947378 RepID=UPI00360A0B6C